MKKRIYMVCLMLHLPLVLVVLIMQYGDREGNFERQEAEYIDNGKAPSVKVFQAKEPGFDLNEKSYDGIHSISFCREWKDCGDRENPVTVVRVVRR